MNSGIIIIILIIIISHEKDNNFVSIFRFARLPSINKSAILKKKNSVLEFFRLLYILKKTKKIIFNDM